jgi:hypothetical protein
MCPALGISIVGELVQFYNRFFCLGVHHKNKPLCVFFISVTFCLGLEFHE